MYCREGTRFGSRSLSRRRRGVCRGPRRHKGKSRGPRRNETASCAKGGRESCLRVENPPRPLRLELMTSSLSRSRERKCAPRVKPHRRRSGNLSPRGTPGRKEMGSFGSKMHLRIDNAQRPGFPVSIGSCRWEQEQEREREKETRT